MKPRPQKKVYNSYAVHKRSINYNKLNITKQSFFPMLLLVSLRMYCDTTSHSPRSKSCLPPPANGTCNALEPSPPCGYFVGVDECSLGNAVFVYLPMANTPQSVPFLCFCEDGNTTINNS